MPKEDYLLKFIEKLNRVIAAMMGFREKGNPEDALNLAKGAYTELLSLDMSEIELMDEAAFAELLNDRNINVSYLGYLSEILFQTGAAYAQKEEKEKSVQFYGKARLALMFQIKKDKTFSFEREARLKELKTLMQS